jgi:hypothetical protein
MASDHHSEVRLRVSLVDGRGRESTVRRLAVVGGLWHLELASRCESGPLVSVCLASSDARQIGAFVGRVVARSARRVVVRAEAVEVSQLSDLRALAGRAGLPDPTRGWGGVEQILARDAVPPVRERAA